MESLTSLIENLNQREKWELSPTECEEFALALQPWLESPPEFPDNLLEIIIINFYHDGPVIMQIRDGSLNDTNEQVVREWRAYIASIARSRFSLDANLVDDIVQDTWVDVMRAFRQRKFHFRSRFTTYLFSLVINRTLNTLRKERRTLGNPQSKAISFDEEESDLSVSASGLRDTEYSAIENIGIVELVVEALERYRSRLYNGQISPQVKIQLANLVLLQGDELREASKKLGLNYNTSVSILRRVREFLKQLPELRDYHND